jgi:IS30 family transposase
MGRRPASTPEERTRVRVLAKEGFSQREIAERVFGGRRYHGRVERILKRDAVNPDAEWRELFACLETLTAELREADLPDLDELVDLYSRRSLQKRLEREPEKVRVTELARLFQLQLRLEQRRAYRAARELTIRAP